MIRSLTTSLENSTQPRTMSWKRIGLLGNVQADGARLSGACFRRSRFGRIEFAAGSRIDRGAMLFHGLLALLFELLRGAEAVISLAFG